MPTNLYGPGDNYSATESHVLPALIRRYHEAVAAGDDDGDQLGLRHAAPGVPPRRRPRRACLFLLENYDEPAPINVGTGTDLTIAELAEMVAEITGFTGETRWDTSKPDGTPQKQLDVSRINELGWKAEIGLRDGVERTYREFMDSRMAGTARNLS